MPSPKSVMPKALRPKAEQPPEQPAADVKHNILQVGLEGGRGAVISVPMDLTEVEALQILGALPGWLLAARADWLRRTAGGRIIVPIGRPS